MGDEYNFSGLWIILFIIGAVVYFGYNYFHNQFISKVEADCYQQYLFTGNDENKIPSVNSFVFCLKDQGITASTTDIRQECLAEAAVENSLYCKPKSQVQCSSKNELYLECVRGEGLAN